MKNRRKAVAALVVTLGLIAYLVSLFLRPAGFDKRPEDQTLHTHLAARTETPPLWIHRVDTGDRSVLYIGYMKKPSLASGPAVFAFDGKGALIGYTSDIGDDPVFRERFDPWAEGYQLLNPDSLQDLLSRGAVKAPTNDAP